MDNQVLEILKRRVSLRTYDNQPVTEEELNAILKDRKSVV